MTVTITELYRYPVKGLSAEKLTNIPLTRGRCLPHDRRFAIALPTTRFDPENPQWLAKTHFIMLMRDEKLARLQTSFDPDGDTLTVAEDGRARLCEKLTEPAGARRVAAFFEAFLSGLVERPLRVVEAPGHTFADARKKPNATADQYVSLINRASIAALERAIGASVDPLRFRANVYFEGLPEWAEHDWLDREITVGSAGLRIVSAITRCAATEVNPVTAQRDLDVVGTLRRSFGHNLMGVYGEVIGGGAIAIGSTIAASP
jgi:uncharacterized protein YcbX